MPGLTVKNEPIASSTSESSSAGMATVAAPIRSVVTAPTNQGHGRLSRFARSGAPSVDTRATQHTALQNHDNISNGDDEDEPVLMEVRKIKPQPDGDHILGQLEPLPLQGPAGAAMSGTMAVAAPGGVSGTNNSLSFVTNGFTAIGDKVKELNDTLGELQSLGIQHVASLPELVLVGDQSAGKSSLMSSFSGLYLPRSEGACTRCPVHIRLSGSSSQGGTEGGWSCRISLQQDYAYRPPQAVTRAQPFGPWFEQRRDIKEFANLRDPAKIEETLRWAQIATLNPSRHHSLYKPSTGEIWRRYRHQTQEGDGEWSGPEAPYENEAAFSPNTVALDILAPGLADLSFYDLPGVFTSARRDEDQYLVKVVENLTAKYISHQQAIILWAVPMNADPETSSTFSIIRAQKAQSRTIGVMTKADLLPPHPGAAAQWMAMLRGEQHRVGHGYFMTARPTVTDENMPGGIATPEPDQSSSSRPADELERQGAFEEAFFNKQLPGLGNQEWRACFQDFEERCGVSRLVSFMSMQLGHEFAKCLPQIKEKVTAKLLDVNYELACLPDLPENPELEVRRSLAEFASQVRPALEGPALAPLLGEIVQQFQRDIFDLKPRYIVRVETGHAGTSAAANGGGRIDLMSGSGSSSSRIDLTRDDDMISLHSSASPAPQHPEPPSAHSAHSTAARRRRHAEFLDGQHEAATGPSTPSKRARSGGPGEEAAIKLETYSDYSPSMSRGTLFRPDHLTPHTSRSHQHSAHRLPPRARARSLQQVRDIVAAKSKPGMPNIVTEDVYDALCMEAVRPWQVPLTELLDRAHRLLDAALHDLLQTTLRRLRARAVFREAAEVIRKLLAERVDATRATLGQHYLLETRRFYTLDRAGLLRHEEAEAKMLMRHRHYYRMVAFRGDGASNANGAVGTAGQGGAAAGNDTTRYPLCLVSPHWEQLADEERTRLERLTAQDAAKLGADPFRIELGVCAYVRGYYLTAATRFVDMCALHLASGLVPEVVDSLAKWHVDRALGVFDGATPQAFLDLMAEDVATTARRAALQEDRRRFERTVASIERLKSGSFAASSQNTTAVGIAQPQQPLQQEQEASV